MLDSIRRAFKSMVGGHEDIYALDHASTNVTLPPEHMWMNMGYWKDAKSFPDACEALLEQVLIAAGLLNEDKSPVDAGTLLDSTEVQSKLEQGRHATFKLVDVGLGKLHRSTNTYFKYDEKQTPISLFDSYVGIKITPAQVDVARNRLETPPNSKPTSPTGWTPNVQVFATDAGQPASWDHALKEAIFCAELNPYTAPPNAKEHTWLPGLDTVYHLRPSHIHFWKKIRLRLMCLAAGIPYANLMTKEE
ncbi:conserved hypothetical protein [Talaromyces stipitatus ATCC 10500]|uniref:Uncharacterized protein n=1 Tax=Talaromyces stipitatus (strain ATCC 10500 / CBS 375.48 / QM 6759 / NRRL 1006) TaxID=441959 RepID=B8LZC4_TALSN|nr:uncharacterized protein TSTA_089130 [Talaromyces stipitatus ATCC 10500]EED21677.1 conserved hypothetical protein [Talaromyces stipitatus ATCC 10500]